MISSVSYIFDKFIHLKTYVLFVWVKQSVCSLRSLSSFLKQADYTNISDLSAARKSYTCARTHLRMSTFDWYWLKSVDSCISQGKRAKLWWNVSGSTHTNTSSSVLTESSSLLFASTCLAALHAKRPEHGEKSGLASLLRRWQGPCVSPQWSVEGCVRVALTSGAEGSKKGPSPAVCIPRTSLFKMCW